MSASAQEWFEWRDNFKNLLVRFPVVDDPVFADWREFLAGKQGMVEAGAHQVGGAVRHDFTGAVGHGDIDNARFPRSLFDQVLELLGVGGAHHHRGSGARADKTDDGLALVEKTFGHDPFFPLQIVGREEKNNGNKHAYGSGQNPGGGVGKWGGNDFGLFFHDTVSRREIFVGRESMFVS